MLGFHLHAWHHRYTCHPNFPKQHQVWLPNQLISSIIRVLLLCSQVSASAA
jgi:hypothetical protein